ncbi:MAG: hypothetical protein KDB00_22600 [Planctomycetales bacterium]|nr:hypothetical protein [Planctomycetales bacterium]
MNRHQRPIWIIIFAILMACVAIRTRGQEISDAASSASEASPSSETSPTAVPGPSAEPQYNTIQIGDQIYRVERSSVPANAGDAMADNTLVDLGHLRQRPKYAFVSAEIAQMDFDANPDGWLAHVMLMDSNDRPVVVGRATAKFELVPRLPTHDFTGYVNANVKSMTWTMPLHFDQDAMATVRLKLRNPITPLIGWPSTSHPAVGQAGGFFSSRRGIIRHATPQYDARTEVTDRWNRSGALGAIGMASFGELKVRVSVPGEGVFDAVAPVALRPSVLVDTRWPYQ